MSAQTERVTFDPSSQRPASSAGGSADPSPEASLSARLHTLDHDYRSRQGARYIASAEPGGSSARPVPAVEEAGASDLSQSGGPQPERQLELGIADLVRRQYPRPVPTVVPADPPTERVSPRPAGTPAALTGVLGGTKSGMIGPGKADGTSTEGQPSEPVPRPSGLEASGAAAKPRTPPDNALSAPKAQALRELAGTPNRSSDDALPKAGGGSGGRGSGGTGGSGQDGNPPLQKRMGGNDFREVLSKGLEGCRRKLYVVCAFSFWVNILILGVPIYLFNVSDRVLTSRSVDTLVMLSIVILGAILGHVMLDMVRRILLMRIAVDVESRLGGPVLGAAARASHSGSSREFQTLADLQQLRAFITGSVLLTMLDAPVAPIYLLTVFLIHPDLGWIVTVTGIILLVLALINQRITEVPFARANAFSTRANLQADAMARNSAVINAMGMVAESVQIWGRETAESLKAQVLAQDRNTVVAGVSKFVRLCTQISMLGWGAWLALEGKLTGGMMIAASIIASRALAPVEGIIDGWRSFVQFRSSYARIRSLLQNSPLNIERLRLPRPTGRLNVDRVLYVPPPNKRVILNGISFNLDPGESIAIVGASGSGKSTLARMLVGSIGPTAGCVRLDMMDLRNWDPRQFGESVGYLPQDVQLFPASIKANIARMRSDVSDEAIFEAAEIADVHDLISSFAQGYETIVAMDGSPLSGGQKQRIGLARAFFGDPRLIVLDEPNSNLDSLGEAALSRALLRAKAKGMTVVAITQRPALLKSVDKIMIVSEGSIKAMGNRDDMLPLLAGRRPGARGAPATGGEIIDL